MGNSGNYGLRIAVWITGLMLFFGGQASAKPTLPPGTWVDITPRSINRSSGFGCNDVKFAPSNPSILYVCVDMQGLYKSTDGGSSWALLGANTACTYSAAVNYIDSPLHLRVDPTDANHLYCAQGVRGCTQGFWVSHDGGNSWTQSQKLLDSLKTMGAPSDVYTIAPDPADFNHVLITFHYYWDKAPGSSSGIMESFDGGNNWVVHRPLSSWGTGHSITILSNPAKGLGDSKTWLLGTQGDGFWRTTNAGASWTQVKADDMTHGGDDFHYSSKTGYLYGGKWNGIMRSTDNGATWQDLTSGVPYSGFFSVVGDGNNLYTQQSCPCGSGTNSNSRYFTSPESDGVTWKPYNTQTFSNGPFDMVFDSANRIIYSANWQGGVWALRVIDPTTVTAGSTQTADHTPAGIRTSVIRDRRIVLERRASGGFESYDIKGKLLGRSLVKAR